VIQIKTFLALAKKKENYPLRKKSKALTDFQFSGDSFFLEEIFTCKKFFRAIFSLKKIFEKKMKILEVKKFKFNVHIYELQVSISQRERGNNFCFWEFV